MTGPLAIELRNLHKSYRGRPALAGLDLQVPAGGVHGLLGPNGSGKTTTIKILLGLVRADSGWAQIFGQRVPERLPQVIGRIGAIVEAPKFFPGYSAELNLRLLARSIGLPQPRVIEALDEVGLLTSAAVPFKALSLGMKQRLALAATLLKEPELLIFDEPTNGLDPAGIQEVRATIRRLATQGRTVLLSSHLLSEVEQLADTVSVIARGRLVGSGPVSQLVGAGRGGWRVEVAELGRAADLATAAGWQVAINGRELLVTGAARPEQITRLLAENGLFVARLVADTASLEQIYLSLTAGAGLRGNWAAAMTKEQVR